MSTQGRRTFSDVFKEAANARIIVGEVAHHTPLNRSATLSRMTGGELYLKLESLQRTGSFKVRGASYAISRLSQDDKARGCVAASAGNHAQGVAYAASVAGMKATIIMPELSSAGKVLATQAYGAEVILHGKTYEEAQAKALEVCEERKSVFIHPFDDLGVIAGQGTIGFELLGDMPDLDVVVVPVGGGGLISGIGVVVKNLKPDVKIYGVQASGAPSMAYSLKEGKIAELSNTDTIADGIAIKKPGDLNFDIVKNLVDDMVTVDDDEIVRSMFLLLERCKQVVEPAGAAGLAALLEGKVQVKGKRVAVIISGGNVNMTLLTRVVESSLFEEGKLAKISGFLPDKPGMLQEVLMTVARARANVVTVEHDRVSPHIQPGRAKVVITVEVPSKKYSEELVRALAEAGYQFKVSEP